MTPVKRVAPVTVPLPSVLVPLARAEPVGIAIHGRQYESGATYFSAITIDACRIEAGDTVRVVGLTGTFTFQKVVRSNVGAWWADVYGGSQRMNRKGEVGPQMARSVGLEKLVLSEAKRRKKK